MALLMGAGLLWWLLVTTEGVYLGRKMVIWLYDLYAQRYDTLKNTNPTYELAFTAHPIIARMPIADPLLLDVATGTGRLPDTLLQHTEFAGQIIGIDLSRAMLVVAAQKLKTAIQHGQVLLLNGPAEQLPFADASVDIITCLEALEFMMNDRVVLEEMKRVLRPGGFLVVTNRQGRDRILMPRKVRTYTAFEALLQDDLGFQIDTVNHKWSDIYGLVIASKPGQAESIGTQEPLWRVLRCPNCVHTALQPIDGYPVATWRCEKCEHLIQQAFDGIIELRS